MHNNRDNPSTNNTYLQHTLAAPVHFVGRGLHGGNAVRMSLLPAEANSGYVFERRDVPAPHNVIHARWLTVSDTRLSTSVANSAGVSVKTVEHLMAALFACGVDNCRIVIDGAEVPIMDGSARPFVEQILGVGLRSLAQQRMAIVVTEPTWIREGGAEAGLVPFPAPWVDMTIDFESPVIGRQSVAVPINRRHFSEHICGARTFGFAEQVETLQALGLARGGSLRNAILVKDDTVANPEGLRYSNEFVRHKVVDAVGDLSLLGVTIVGCFVGRCSGHRLNNQLLRTLMLKTDHWKYTTLRDATENWEQLLVDPAYGGEPGEQFARHAEAE